MSLKRLIQLFFTFAILIVLIPRELALAHEVQPIHASPADGAILEKSPTQIKLIFPEEISENGSTVQVFDAKGHQVDTGDGGVDLSDPDHVTLIASLPELPQGVYLVKWQIVLDDGDTSQGKYYFGIGNVTLPAAAPVNPVDTTGKSSSYYLPWIVAGVILIVILGMGIYFARRLSKRRKIVQ